VQLSSELFFPGDDMNRPVSAAAVAAVSLTILGACEAQKSSNPLSPSVAGPIPGVTISAPTLIEPAQGFRFKEAEQPIKLVIQNSSTSGVRPVTYLFEVASDSDFNTKVFARGGVAPGEGRTSVQIDRLELGRAYYWRARADDGANASLYSTAQFEVLPKPLLTAPGPLSPINNERVTARRPTFIISNSDRNASVGALHYDFQVALDQAFTQMITSGIVDEAGGQTTFTAPNDLPYDRVHYWRVKAFDNETTGPWAVTQTFRSSTAPVPVPGPSPSPGIPGNWESCGSTPGDQLVQCVHAAVNPSRTVEGAFEVTKRVAWLLRGGGAGLLIKNGGENIVSWKGYSFAAARICYPDGHIYKVLSDVPSTNGPSWQDNDFVDRSLYVVAIDPR
jgi:hypothetical protein